MPLSLGSTFRNSSGPVLLPLGAILESFRHEGYHDISREGPVRPVYELLANLRHPEGNHNNETYFKEISDRGLTSQVDAIIIPQALIYARDRNLLPAAVNVYPETLLDQSFAPRLLEFLKEEKIDPGNVVFEILERRLDPNADYSPLAKLTDAGIRLAIDDHDPRHTLPGANHELANRLPLLAPHVSIVKVDKYAHWNYEDGHYGELPAHVEDLRTQYSHLKVLGEGVPFSYICPDSDKDVRQRRLTDKNFVNYDATQSNGFGRLGLS